MFGFSLCQNDNCPLNSVQAPETPPALSVPAETPVKDERWQTMTDALDSLARRYKGHVGIYLKDLNTDRVWEYNSDRLFPSASLIKVPIMASICEKIKSGELSLDTKLKLTERDRTAGSGELKWARAGTELSVMQIIYRMITESDNTATKMLLNYAGFDYYQRTFADLGLAYTKIYPEGMSLTSNRVAKENYTTPREMAGLLERIYKGEVVDKSSSEFMMDILKHNKNRSRLRKGLPADWELGHKTGLLRRACHDVGIVFSPRGDYLLAVMTGDTPSYSSAKNFITRVARLTCGYYKLTGDYASAARAAVHPVKAL